MDRTCASCAAWLAPGPDAHDKNMGQCRRHPPVPMLAPVQQAGRISTPGSKGGPQAGLGIISAWPPTPAGGGCMDYIKEELS